MPTQVVFNDRRRFRAVHLNALAADGSSFLRDAAQATGGAIPRPKGAMEPIPDTDFFVQLWDNSAGTSPEWKVFKEVIGRPAIGGKGQPVHEVPMKVLVRGGYKTKQEAISSVSADKSTTAPSSTVQVQTPNGKTTAVSTPDPEDQPGSTETFAFPTIPTNYLYIGGGVLGLLLLMKMLKK